MTPHYADDSVTLHHGDCLDVLRELPDASVHAVVTDPPYGLGFMGKAWDDLPPGREWAEECLRVLKPGGHLLAFGGSRTWHRLACAVEDAGFEVRDSIAWLYGSGFSKGGLLGNKDGMSWCSCDAKPIPYDHAGNADLLRLRSDVHPSPVARGQGEDAHLLTTLQREAAGRGVGSARAQGPGSVVGGVRGGAPGADDGPIKPGMAGRLLHRAGQGLPDGADAGAPAGPGERVRGGAPARDGADDRAAGRAARGGSPRQPGSGGQPSGEPGPVPDAHGPLDDGALRGRPVCPRCGGLPSAFRGFSTTLKPAFEPIVVARKPLTGTVAANVLAHGTGALNIDATRVGDGTGVVTFDRAPRSDDGTVYDLGTVTGVKPSGQGRWPANVLLDGSQADELDRQSGTSTSRIGKPRGADHGDGWGMTATGAEYDDAGGASRFFPTFRYDAKAPTDERPRVDGVAHPTVKPLDLMRWLVRLVTPPGGTVLEPFAGSGTTAEACVIEGFRCIAVEREAAYLPLIVARISKPIQPDLFGAHA